MKTAKFRKLELIISKASGYGSYILTANYKGKEVKVRTNNSECYDWLNDDSNIVKHLEAKRYAYNAIVNASN